jgi:hypothetical protein
MYTYEQFSFVGRNDLFIQGEVELVSTNRGAEKP